MRILINLKFLMIKNSQKPQQMSALLCVCVCVCVLWFSELNLFNGGVSLFIPINTFLK